MIKLVVIYNGNTSNIFILQSAVESGVNKLYTREGYLFLMEKSKYINFYVVNKWNEYLLHINIIINLYRGIWHNMDKTVLHISKGQKGIYNDTL